MKKLNAQFDVKKPGVWHGWHIHFDMELIKTHQKQICTRVHTYMYILISEQEGERYDLCVHIMITRIKPGYEHELKK